MAEKRFRVVHFINHFFAGVGGEEKANHPIEVRQGPLGPGQGLASHLGKGGEIVATIFCGDNYFSENLEVAK
ncbi:MAG: glycine/betaine/sarcosine/D-proline family reductase selenoprotein B, partial [Chloroflexi bacterium]|nr:glycine/betaine/sarcosine/D-proline family reductase selenoprotein B [Chloroflexota bacterium]